MTRSYPRLSPKKHRPYAKLIFCAAAGIFVCCAGRTNAGTTWLNSGESWNGFTNWSDGLPDVSTIGMLPAALTRIDPLISGDTTVLGLHLDNTDGAYSVGGGGTLSLLNGGITLTGGGTSVFSVSTVLQANSSIDIASNTVLRFAAPLDLGAFGLQKLGAGTLILDASVVGIVPNQPVTISGGVLRLTRNGTLGVTSANTPLSRSITIESGAALELQPADADLTLGDPEDPLGSGGYILMRGDAALRAITPSEPGRVTILGGGRSPRLADNSTAVFEAQDDTNLVNLGSLGNETNQLFDSGAVLTCRGSGVIQFVHSTSGANAFTGDVEVDMTDDELEVGALVIHDAWALGHRTNGRYAGARLKSGYMIDGGSSPTDPFDGPITFNGGLLAQTAAIAPLPRGRGYYTGAITVSSEGGAVDLRDIFLPDLNLTTEFAGQLTGAGSLELLADNDAPAKGVLRITRTSTISPNSYSGLLLVKPNAQLNAIAAATGSNPLASATIALAGGELKLSHPGGAGNITTFATNAIQLTGSETTVSTITLDAGSISTSVNLSRLTFDAESRFAKSLVAIGSGTAPHTLRFLNGAQINGTCTFNTDPFNPADVIIASGMSGAGHLIKSGVHALTIAGSTSAFTGTIRASEGKLNFADSARPGELTIEHAGTVRMLAAGNHLLRVSQLSMPASGSNTGTLDLADNDLIVTAGNVSTIRNLLTTGRANAPAAARGITTSAGSNSKTLGYATASQLNATTFRGEAVSGTDVIVRYTFYGDADLNGKVNTLDFNRLAGAFGTSQPDWHSGDFNFDSAVNSLDFVLLAANHGANLNSGNYVWPVEAGSLIDEPGLDLSWTEQFDTAVQTSFDPSMVYRNDSASITGSSVGTVVPEPATLGLVSICAMGMMKRSRRITPR